MRPMLFVLLVVLFMGCELDEADDPGSSAAADDTTGDELDSVSQELTTQSVLPTSGFKRINVPIVPGHNELIMSSPSSGDWTFKTWNYKLGMFSCGGTGNPPKPPDIVVYTYWKDASNPNNPWNYWPGGGPVCWMSSMFSTNLHSGSKNIIYKFAYEQYGSYATTVIAEFTKR